MSLLQLQPKDTVCVWEHCWFCVHRHGLALHLMIASLCLVLYSTSWSSHDVHLTTDNQVALEQEVKKLNHTLHGVNQTNVELQKGVSNVEYEYIEVIPHPLYSVFSQYESKYEIRKLLQEIEYNIQFTNSTSSAYNDLYSTGYSPHYYNGPYDLRKTSKHIRFPYLCKPGTVNRFSDWTSKLDQSNLTYKANELLHELQRLGFYGNLYTFYMNNLHRYRSPYIQPMNVLWFGNSHRKQIHQSMFALIDTLNLTDIVDIVQSYFVTPIIANKQRLPVRNISYSDLRCDSWGLHAPNDWPGKNVLHFGWHKSAMRTVLDRDRYRNNIENCKDQFDYTNFKDSSNDTSFMLGTQEMVRHKKLKHIYKWYLNQMNHQNHQMSESSDVDMHNVLNVNWDILIFNVGNDPGYKADIYLESDLHFFGMEKRSVVLMSKWYVDDTLPLKSFELDNVIVMDWSFRLRRLGSHKNPKKLQTKWQAWTGHYCMPGVPDHAMLSINHLVNLLKFVDDMEFD
eukprot:58587_1